MTPVQDQSTLVDALREEKACYEEMLSLARGQREVLLSDEADPILALMEKKRRILGRLDRVKERSADARDRWPQARQRLPVPAREEVERLAGEVEQVLAELLRIEEEATRLAGALKDGAGEQLRKQADTQRLRQAYRPRREGEGKFLDHKE